MQPGGFVAYELKGESLEAAAVLHARVRTILTRDPVVMPPGSTLGDMHREYATRYGKAIEEIRRDEPALATLCGLLAPALQVQTQDGAHPRAYESYPEIFMTSAKMPLCIMICPVDYKDNHFVPKDAQKCDPADLYTTDTGDQIYKGLYWVRETPIISPGCVGRPMPHDFDPATAHTQQGYGPMPGHCFRAGGDTLYTLDLMAREKAAFEGAWKDLSTAIHDWADKNHPGHYVNISMKTEDHENILTLSLRVENTGAPVEWKGPDWTVIGEITRTYHNTNTGQTETIHTKEYEVRPDPSTPAGMALYKLLKAVPPLPASRTPSELQVTFNAKAHNPVIYRTPQGCYLAYNDIPADAKITPPGGCTESSPAEINWLERDRRDEGMGVVPPPPPAALAHLYKAPPRAPQP